MPSNGRTPSSTPAIIARLAAFNRWRLSPALPEDMHGHDFEEDTLRAIEIAFVESQRPMIRARAAAAPSDAAGFVAWFEKLEQNGPGQHDPLFPYLEERATFDEMRWFLRQEISGEAGFDDLVAMTQVKMPPRVKLELARNYWDEMGQGHASGMHGPMLGRLAEELGLARPDQPEAGEEPTTGDAPKGDEAIVWQSTALANLMVALATHRRYAYHSIGALGVIELTAPGRAKCVNAGLKRLGIDGEARRYFALHATLDVKHSQAWNREVLAPLVEADSRVARPIAEGALLRLAAGAACFERYRAEIGLTVSLAKKSAA